MSDRVDAQQRGRLAMDRVTSLLSSQVCVSSSIPPLIGVGSTDKSVTFYGDLHGRQQHALEVPITFARPPRP